MRQLHHFPLSPFCRRVRLVLGEKRLTFDSHAERPWEPKDELFPLDPAKQLPVLIETDSAKLSDAQAICEYLEELHPDPPLMPKRAGDRAEVRRLCAWFDRFFFGEITSVVVREKYLKRFRQVPSPEPDLAALRPAIASPGRSASPTSRPPRTSPAPTISATCRGTRSPKRATGTRA
jgi:glutathione S-transferase